MATGDIAETDLPGALRAELRALLARGQQNGAIERYRAETGADLATARAVIDSFARSDGAALRRASLSGLLRLLTGFLWLCAMLAAIASAWQAHERSVVRTTWPQVEARVLKCSVVEHTLWRVNAFSTLGCQFQYDVRGVPYTARTVTTGIPTSKQVAAMHRWIGKHRPGTRQLIHYDPANPRRISPGNADESFQADTPAQRLRLAGIFAVAGVLLFAAATWLATRRQVTK